MRLTAGARRFLAALTGLGLALPALAQEAASELDFFQLDDALNQAVTVAAREALTPRESPGIVTVMSRAEILALGARDLDDVLRQVPGFEVGLDYYGMAGIGIRGLWGIEGKVLLLVDGLEVNELYYNEALLGGRLPVDQVQRVEIIRGPGSTLYGGAAEYAVINVVTQGAAELQGVRLTGTYGQLAHANGRRDVGVAWGQRFGEGPRALEASVKVYTGEMHRSDGPHTLLDGTELSMRDQYVLSPLQVNASLGVGGFSARLLVERSSITFSDYSTTGLQSPTRARNDGTFAQAKYEWSLGQGLTLTPAYQFTRTTSYRVTAPDDELVTVTGESAADLHFDYVVDRHKLSLPLSLSPLEQLQVMVGLEGQLDIGRGTQSVFYLPSGETVDTRSSNTGSAFAQGILSTPVGSFTAGARYDHNSLSGGAFVPRLAWTKVFERAHLKALYSMAYRAPSLGNVNDAAAGGSTVGPEHTRVLELEAGFAPVPGHYLSVNLFDLRVKGPLTFVQESSIYTNGTRTGSRGLELEHRVRAGWGSATLGYSFYTARGINDVAAFAVPGHPEALLGFSPHKLTARASLDLPWQLKLNPSFALIGRRYTVQGDADADGAADLAQLEPVALLGLFVSRENLGLQGLEASLGVHDLLGQTYQYAPAFDFGRNPMPGPGREVMLRLSYQLPL